MDNLEFVDTRGSDITGQVLALLKERFGDGVLATGKLLHSEVGAVKAMANHYGVPWIGSIAQDLELSKATEHGRLIQEDGINIVARQVEEVVAALTTACEDRKSAQTR